MSKEIENTHTINFLVDITQHGVPEGAKRVVSERFWGFDGDYGNVPIEMVLEVQTLGTEFLGQLVELGKKYNVAKKAAPERQ